MSRRPGRGLSRTLGLAAAALLLAAPGHAAGEGGTPLSMQVNGRELVVPVPPGMVRYNVTHAGYFHWFEAVARRREGPYFACAAVRAHDESRAAEALARQVDSRLGTDGPAARAAWTQAMRAGMAGRSGALPRAPEGFVLIERVTSSSSQVIDVLHQRQGSDRGLVANATVLVRGRALALTVVLKQPADQLDLSRVRSEIVEWVAALRAANL